VTNLRYSSNHIITLKVDYQYASMLKKMNKGARSVEMYKEIESVIVACLRQKELAG
jgi:hypothetical protein